MSNDVQVVDDDEEMALSEAMAMRRAAHQPLCNAEAKIRPAFVTRAARKVAALEAKDETAEIAGLMEEAEKEQRHAYMQRVRDELRSQRAADSARRVAPLQNEMPTRTKQEIDKEKELTQIKNSYLGVKKKKKKAMKISEKFRFSFDWGPEEVRHRPAACKHLSSQIFIPPSSSSSGYECRSQPSLRE